MGASRGWAKEVASIGRGGRRGRLGPIPKVVLTNNAGDLELCRTSGDAGDSELSETSGDRKINEVTNKVTETLHISQE